MKTIKLVHVFIISILMILSIYSFYIPITLSSTFSAKSSLEVYEIKKTSLDTLKYNLSLLYSEEYHNLSALYDELQYFNESAPELIDYTTIGQSYAGNEIPLIKLTNENAPDDIKGKTYLVSHHHAREMCTIENTIRIIRDLVNSYNIDEEITNLLDNTVIYFIVTLNPDSLDYTLYQNEHFRKSMKPYDDDGDGLYDEDGPQDINDDGSISEFYVYTRPDTSVAAHWIEGWDRDGDGLIAEDPPGGVDLNRNYPYRWNYSRCDSGSGENLSSFVYQGPAPFSENETRILDNFVKKHKFTHALSLHSGVQMLLLGWGWTRVNQAEQSKYNSIISDVQSSGLLPSSFRPETFIGYTTAGEWGDYMYAEYGIISSTLEIYGKAKIDLLVQIDQNDTHTKYERKFTDFEQFNPPIDEFEVLHSGLLKFEKYWFKLTPQINLVGIDKRKISNGTYELTLHLCSGSKYWNTTDNPQINVISSNDEIIESYPNEIPTLYPSNPQELKIVLKSNLPDNFSLDINITSDWAADLSLHIQVRPEEFKAVTGFSYLIIVSVFLLFVPVIKKNK